MCIELLAMSTQTVYQKPKPSNTPLRLRASHFSHNLPLIQLVEQPPTSRTRPRPALLIQPFIIKPHTRLPSPAGARRPWLRSNPRQRTGTPVAGPPLIIKCLVQKRTRAHTERTVSPFFARCAGRRTVPPAHDAPG